MRSKIKNTKVIQWRVNRRNLCVIVFMLNAFAAVFPLMLTVALNAVARKWSFAVYGTGE